MVKKLKKQKLIAEIMKVVGYVSVVLFSILFIEDAYFYIGIIIGLLFILIGRAIFRRLRETINERLMPEIYKTKLGKSIHRPLEGFNNVEVYATNLFVPQDRYISNDLVSGEVFGFKYKLSEVHLLDAKKDFKKLTSNTLFQGSFVEVNVESQIKGSVYIVPKDTELFHYLGKEHEVGLKEPLSNQLKVLSKNKKEAQKLLDEEFISLLEKITTTFPNTYIAVKKHAIYIAIDSRKKPLIVKLFRRLDLSYLDVLSHEIITMKEIVYTLYKKTRFQNK